MSGQAAMQKLLQSQLQMLSVYEVKQMPVSANTLLKNTIFPMQHPPGKNNICYYYARSAGVWKDNVVRNTKAGVLPDKISNFKTNL